MASKRDSLRARLPFRVLEGFGGAVRAACRYAAPESAEQLAELLAQARAEAMPVAFRGAGRSYGDPALLADGIVVDTSKLTRVRSWDRTTGVIDTEPGLTIEGLWRKTLPEGWWPAVVPGTMRPTLAGCAAMNVHGKNNFRVGPTGDHVLDFDLATPTGELLRCSRTENADLFHAAISGAGLLGAFTRIRLKLKKVETGKLRVRALRTRNIEENFDVFEEHLPDADYLVGWIDCVAGGGALGRGQVHVAHYLHDGEDPDGARGLLAETQDLPSTIMGVPRGVLWRFMRPFFNDLGVGMVNTGKYAASVLGHESTYLQSHVAFAFLLDYVPNWRLSYGSDGFIQHQIFVPHAHARRVFRDVLELCRRRGHPSYLGVMKRHRPDDFLMTHAVDGWSLAMDFRVVESRRAELWSVMHEVSELALDAGGRLYFAKDAVMKPEHALRAWGEERLAKFAALKRRVDPDGVLQSELYRRALAPLMGTKRSSRQPVVSAAR